MHEQGFLDAIIASPEDDSPRLVYADWLEEHGFGERAEFIRVQCELACKAKYDASRLPLQQREQELLAAHKAQWAKPVASIIGNYEFHRGFVDTVAIGARKLLSHGAKLFRLAPIRNVKVGRLGSSSVAASDLASCDLLPRIRGLVLQGNLTAEDLRTLLTAPALKKLAALKLECYFPASTLELLLAGSLPHLESLDLGVGGATFTQAQIEALAQARWASSLRHLNLKDHRINVGGVEAIAASKQFKGLTHLILYGSGAGLRGTQALAGSSSLSNLTTLDLRRNGLSDSAARALAASSKLPALTELYLGMNQFSPDGAKALAEWPGLARLRFLHLYGNPIGDDGVCALAESPHVANLWYLDVTNTEMGDRGARALAESPYLKNVRIGSFSSV